MNRPPYTVLYSLFIIALFFGTTSIYQACGNNSNKDAEESLAEKVEEIADNYTEEEFFEEDETEDDIVDFFKEEDAKPKDTSGPQSTSTNNLSDDYSTPSFSASRVGAGSGEFLVVSGNYLLENNADVMVRKLRAAGFSQAEKVVFDLSQYYTVIAGRYKTRALASSISSELNGKRIDNYVLRRKD